MRVLHVIQGKHFGGAEQVILTLAKCSDHSKVEPLVLCLADGLLSRKLSEVGILNFIIPMKTKVDLLLPLIRTIKLIRHENIDIVHTHSVRSNLIGRLAALFSGCKCITHLHSPILRDFMDLKRCKLNDFIDSLTRPVADRYVAVSHCLRQEVILRGMPRQKILTIQNGLDLESQNLSTRNNGVSNKCVI